MEAHQDARSRLEGGAHMRFDAIPVEQGQVELLQDAGNHHFGFHLGKGCADTIARSTPEGDIGKRRTLISLLMGKTLGDECFRVAPILSIPMGEVD